MARNIFSVGVNDCSGSFVAGCVYYNTWYSMIRRCYSKKFLLIRPTYKGCSVVESWLLFSNFKAWMKSQDWKGKNLDKDVLIKGNKVYGPESCVFVSDHVNLIFTNNNPRKTKYPVGVSKGTREGTFKAQCGGNGKDKYIGTYPSISEARQAYVTRKKQILYSLANEQSDSRVSTALIDFAFELN